jgi:hypothetical protein
MAEARRVTGLNDFGADSFREGLEILTASVDAEGGLNDRGRAAFDASLVSLLSCRLQIEYWYARHPEIDEQQIIAPLIGISLPRTGSTALSALLAEDPNIRYLRTWEAFRPCPPPDIASEGTDPRIEQARRMMAARDEMFPRLKIMVPTTATGPQEDQQSMGYDFKSQHFAPMAHIPTYLEWLHHEADLVPTYQYMKRVLKLLQWRRPPEHWRLKSPSHAPFIDALNEVFPDARFWMTHRDITSVLPSLADLYYEIRHIHSDHVDKVALAQPNADWAELGLRRVLAFREGGHDHRFFDIHFAPFQKDPFPILAELYAWLGEDFTEETRARMEAWRKAMPREQHGAHVYRPAEYGIDLSAVRERFRFYTDRFGISTRGNHSRASASSEP